MSEELLVRRMDITIRQISLKDPATPLSSMTFISMRVSLVCGMRRRELYIERVRGESIILMKKPGSG